MPIRVYLADLTHIAQGVATEAFPLNIGLIASYSKKKIWQGDRCTFIQIPSEFTGSPASNSTEYISLQ